MSAHNTIGNHRIVAINETSKTKFISNKISTTKYNFFTFVPRFLFEQFRKYANVYFLGIALLQQIPDVSPTGRFTTLVPLIIILMISAMREIVEDVKRKRSDDAINNKKVPVMSRGIWNTIKWSKLMVGDVVKVSDGEHFPADLIVLSSSEPNGTCYIETSNLDGETNLKVRQAVTETLVLQTESDVAQCKGEIECEQPNKFLYDFVGNIRMNKGLLVPLGPDQVLLRGSMLKNTKWVFGVIVYSGYETKLMLNSNKVPLKRSTVDKVVNRQILMLFCVLLILSWASSLGSYFFSAELESSHWYMGFQDDYTSGNMLYSMLTFVILYNNLIPISLQVTMEMVKFTQAIFIGWDKEMYYGVNDTPAAARTSNLNEELGQVKYIFSDKTGTLTSNIMTLRSCCVAGVIYSKDFEDDAKDLNANKNQNDKNTIAMSKLTTSNNAKPEFKTSRPENAAKLSLQENSLSMKNNRNKSVIEFLTMCAVCHTVVPEPNGLGDLIYQAASPDERALVLGAKRVGYTFTKRTPNAIYIEINGKERKFKVLNVIEFTSARKRMTIIVREPDGQIKVMVKGADAIMMDRLSIGRKTLEEINQNLTDFAIKGLRTLIFGSTTLSQEQYDSWNKIFYEASTSLDDREHKVSQAAELIEKELKLVGASAIEDKLQDGVPDCIDSLLQAGIKIWVLTGDKQETAINIGLSCKLISQDTNIIRINEISLVDTKLAIDKLSRELASRFQGVETNDALIIDGKTLTFALDEECKKNFLASAIACKVVICCRVSPSQKAEIVKMVKQECKAITLAIGDGANDVGMIQEAHVGIGISGEEGLQAVSASDYAIAQFRFLKRLLLVHGHWNYNRVTKLILFCFFKNICFYFIEFWYALLSAFSGQIVFERWTIGLYNVLFTALPPLAIGLFDQVETDTTLIRRPHLYKLPQSSELFNVKVFWLWCLNSVYISIILFWIPCGAMSHDILFSDGKTGTLLYLGNIVYTLVIITVSFKALLEMSSWNVMVIMLTFGSIVLWLIFFPLYSRLWPSVQFAEYMVGMDYYTYTAPIFYVLLLIVPFTALLRDFVAKISQYTEKKSLSDTAQPDDV